MEQAELEQLFDAMESDRVERKASISDPEKIRQAICAFANDLPDHRQAGVVFVGVDDKGACANLAVTDQLLQTLAHMRSDGNITPFPVMAVQKHTLKGCDVAAVIVEPAGAPPVRVRGTAWIRVGPRRAIASIDEERRLSEKRKWKDLPFDLHPVAAADLSDLDEDLFRRVYLPSALSAEVLEQNERSLGHQLLALRFVSTETPPHPTVVGLLVAGKSPASLIGGAYLQFVRYDGAEFTGNIKSQQELHGPLPELLAQVDQLLKANLSVAADVTAGATETRHPDYPIVALQQIVRNAVMHRNYEGTNAPVRIYWFDDRVEILNPGGPYGQVTIDNFGTPGITDYRNPHIAEAMKNLGYVQRFGLGIELTRKEMAKNGNPPPEFLREPTHIAVILRKRA